MSALEALNGTILNDGLLRIGFGRLTDTTKTVKEWVRKSGAPKGHLRFEEDQGLDAALKPWFEARVVLGSAEFPSGGRQKSRAEANQAASSMALPYLVGAHGDNIVPVRGPAKVERGQRV